MCVDWFVAAKQTEYHGNRDSKYYCQNEEIAEKRNVRSSQKENQDDEYEQESGPVSTDGKFVVTDAGMAAVHLLHAVYPPAEFIVLLPA